MKIRNAPRKALPAVIALAIGVAAFLHATRGRVPADPPSVRPRLGTAASLATDRQSLQSIALGARRRLEANPGDGEAAVMLAEALMRSARVESNAALAIDAERALRSALAHAPGDYGVTRLLGVVLLSQHRFADALAAAETARRLRPDDAWNYAVAGDALLELGRYDEAFTAFDELNRRRPDAGSYARAAYARELQGDIAGAAAVMRMAIEATGPQDPEARAWLLCQLANLYLLEGRAADAERELARADAAFPGHPYATMGRARLLASRGAFRSAYVLLAQAHDTPETWAFRGDLARRLGDAAAASRAYREAERLEREGWQNEEPQPGALARFLAERRLNVHEAVALAERAANGRRDIHTMDALAWAYFQAGRVDAASAAITDALRTGTRDPRVRCHADAIASAIAGAQPSDAVCDPLEIATAAIQAAARPVGQNERD